jgi:hypothetical protein
MQSSRAKSSPGRFSNEPMRVETVASNGTESWILGLVGLQSEKFRKVTLTAADLKSLTIQNTTKSYDGDGHLLRLGLQAYALGIAYEFDPYFGLSISRVDPLPHQLEAVSSLLSTRLWLAHHAPLPPKKFLLRFARDRRRYLHWLFEAKKRFGLSVLNYTVTSNHVHLLVKDSGSNVIAESGFSEIQQSCWKGSYSSLVLRKPMMWCQTPVAAAGVF